MRDKNEEQRWSNRIIGFWAIITILVAVLMFISVTGMRSHFFYSTVAIAAASLLLGIIIFITRKQR